MASDKLDKRPPRRNSAQNINFKKMVNSTFSDDEREQMEKDTFFCSVCQKSSTSSDDKISKGLIDLLKNILQNYDLNSSETKLCDACIDNLKRLKTIEHEANQIRNNFIQKFTGLSQSSGNYSSLKENEKFMEFLSNGGMYV